MFDPEGIEGRAGAGGTVERQSSTRVLATYITLHTEELSVPGELGCSENLG